MRRPFPILALALLCAAGLVPSARAEAPSAPTRRFALVVGANRGGERNVRLRYAASDARAFAALLTELGGVRPEDLILLLDPPLSAFKDAAERLRAQSASAEAAGQRCELMLYYSGHSDDEGLLLEGQKLPYAELRAAIERVPAAVRVAILDSCSSGALTRAKGGSSRPAFLFDASSDMEGHAYITSSSADEAAQESDRIGGSFFTHHLVSALRGAADVRGQGKVTLNDAYAYAFRETLASTEKTQYGPQHPAYEISLTGSGDLVFTDLRSSRAGLLLSDELSGSIYVRDSKGNLALELAKEAGTRMEVGLPQGKYSVAMIEGESRRQADVVVPASGRAYLSAGDFRAQTAAERATSRGLAVAGDAGADFSGEDPSRRSSSRRVSFSFNARFKPDLSRGVFSSEEDEGVSVNLFWGQARDVKVQCALFANADSGNLNGLQAAYLANAVKGYARGLQASCLYNAALGGFGGVQSSSVVNYAGEESTGAQIGLVNIASHIKGVQIGLVNVADRIDGLPIGLVNIERDGVLSLECWTEGLSGGRAGFAFGTRHLYTIIQGGFGWKGGSEDRFGGLGMGWRVSVARFYADVDLSWRAYAVDSSEGTDSASRLCLRAVCGFPGKGRGLFAGAAFESPVPGVSRDSDGERVRRLSPKPSLVLGLKI